MRVVGTGSTTLMVSVVPGSTDGSVGANETMLSGSFPLVVQNDSLGSGPDNSERPTNFQGFPFVIPAGIEPRSAASPGLIAIRTVVPSSTAIRPEAESLSRSLTGERPSSVSEAELSLRITRISSKARAAVDWNLMDDATANLFRPLRLHGNDSSPDSGLRLVSDRNQTTLATQLSERNARSESPDPAATDAAIREDVEMPRNAVQGTARRRVDLPGFGASGLDPLSLRFVSQVDYAAIIAAATARTPYEEPRSE
jgi:hypothetical protein